jgi:hypothetical protein
MKKFTKIIELMDRDEDVCNTISLIVFTVFIVLMTIICMIFN